MLIITAGCSPSSDFKLQEPAASSTWPDSLSWWKANNLRLIQTTALEEFEGIIMER